MPAEPDNYEKSSIFSDKRQATEEPSAVNDASVCQAQPLAGSLPVKRYYSR